MVASPSTDDSAEADERQFSAEREELLREIENDFRMTTAWTGRAAPNGRVRDAMGRVPRHAFVPAAELSLSYINTPLPIGWGQTISQPFIVALMTDLLDPEPDDERVAPGLHVNVARAGDEGILHDLPDHVDDRLTEILVALFLFVRCDLEVYGRDQIVGE